jgi:hypothetical protein
MRALTVFLFCLSIALQGVASTRVLDQPCPMAQGMVHAGMMDPADDCCNDAETAAATGKLCKTGEECNLFQVFTIVSLQPPGQIPVATRHPAAGRHVSPSLKPSEIWRPPTLG